MKKIFTEFYCDECEKFIVKTTKSVPSPSYEWMGIGNHANIFEKFMKNNNIISEVFKERENGMPYHYTKEFCSKECSKKFIEKWKK